jgi:hypothetical protein
MGSEATPKRQSHYYPQIGHQHIYYNIRLSICVELWHKAEHGYNRNKNGRKARSRLGSK